MSGIIEKMQAEIDELKRKVTKLEEGKNPVLYTKISGEAIGRALQATAKAAQRLRKPTRAEIVERAKKDIDQLGDIFDFSDGHEDIIVNAEKRTVVCIYRDDFSRKIIRRGIAKCAPEDCFNVHIGKAIALRRALGEEVPDEYLNAPSPEGVEVGDLIRNGMIYTVVDRMFWKTAGDICLADNVVAREGTVIDDSARYE